MRVQVTPAGAGAATESVVIIDVLRAFTTAAYAFDAGASEIWLCGSAEEAFALRDRTRGAVLVGEAGGRQIPGFDHGNSPAELASQDLRGRVVILRSSNGTRGVARAARAAPTAILLGSLVVAAATARHLQRTGGAIELVPMGWIGEPPHAGHAGQREQAGPGAVEHTPGASGTPADASGRARDEGAEDHACAAYLAALLTGAPCDVAATILTVQQSPAGRRAMDPAIAWITPADLACATAVDRFDFAMPVTRRDGLLVARAVPAQ